ncbi:ATP-binding protein [Methanoregula sp.]|jgi:hypothetical protein|uniref:ATP-binding protein n=1 Tax=Methanoregula sp. TaxID=2052170 RepID=UPI003C1F379A
MVDEGRISAIEGAHLLQSLRASDFDIPSAIGELIDNAIQADAKNVHVKVEDMFAGGRKKYKLISKILCGDDGYGMDGTLKGVLHCCIKLGYSSRFNDRSGIGRFGVGMTLAGIRFATKIEVFSKQSGKPWYYIVFDLNNTEDIEIGIAPPIQQDPPEEYQNLCGQDHGTLVIWSGFDKFAEQDLHAYTYDDGLEASASLDPYGYLNHWIGRTYRNFIWDGLNLTVNTNEIFAFDPLFLNKKRNQFPDDEVATLVFEDEIEWPIHQSVKRNADIGDTSKIHIKISFLPRQYRQIIGRGGQDFKGRYIEENEGVSIMRSGREVLYSTIPFFQESNSKKLSWEDKDRWWSCEISFDPELDEHFTVKNIKRGALPAKELKVTLYHKIIEYRRRCLEEVSAYWKEYQSIIVREKEVEYSPDGLSKLPTDHIVAEKIASETKITESPKKLPVITKEEESSRIEELTRELDEANGALWRAKFKSQPFSIKDTRWKGDTFIQVTFLDGQSVLEYNLNHYYFDELSRLRTELQALEDPSMAIRYAKKMNELIDILLMSFVQARKNWTHSDEFSVTDSIDYLIRDWGRYLKSYSEAYQKEQLFEEDL